jgi:hypothetical protein
MRHTGPEIRRRAGGKTRWQRRRLGGAVVVVLLLSTIAANAQTPFVPNDIVTSTVPANGDLNPYGVAFVPSSFPAGTKLAPADILVSNFNNSKNLQGTGTTIVAITPNGSITPGPNPRGVGTAIEFFQSSAYPGLDTGLNVLSEGFVLVCSLPSQNGLYATHKPGALLVLDGNGTLKNTIAGSGTLLDGPWDMTVFDQGNGTVLAFVSNVGNVHDGFVLRLDLTVSTTVRLNKSTVIANGYLVEPNKAAFVFGPTGLVYEPSSDVLYVASTADNAVYAVANASTLTASHGKGTPVFADKKVLRGPLGMAQAPNGDLIVANGDGVNGNTAFPSEYVEFSKTGKFVSEFNIDEDEGGAFGIAVGTGPNSEPRLAVVDDNVPDLTIFTGLPPTLNGANR